MQPSDRRTGSWSHQAVSVSNSRPRGRGTRQSGCRRPTLVEVDRTGRVVATPAAPSRWRRRCRCSRARCSSRSAWSPSSMRRRHIEALVNGLVRASRVVRVAGVDRCEAPVTDGCRGERSRGDRRRVGGPVKRLGVELSPRARGTGRRAAGRPTLVELDRTGRVATPAAPVTVAPSVSVFPSTMVDWSGVVAVDDAAAVTSKHSSTVSSELPV